MNSCYFVKLIVVVFQNIILIVLAFDDLIIYLNNHILIHNEYKYCMSWMIEKVIKYLSVTCFQLIVIYCT